MRCQLGAVPAVIVGQGTFETRECAVDALDGLCSVPVWIARREIQTNQELAVPGAEFGDAKSLNVGPSIECAAPHGSDSNAVGVDAQERTAWDKLDQSSGGTEAEEDDAPVGPEPFARRRPGILEKPIDTKAAEIKRTSAHVPLRGRRISSFDDGGMACSRGLTVMDVHL
jgi:hypothetical protein